jgi:hypothetical protein
VQAQDALVEVFNPAGAANQDSIALAIIAAGVRIILMPDFSSEASKSKVDIISIFAGDCD